MPPPAQVTNPAFQHADFSRIDRTQTCMRIPDKNVKVVCQRLSDSSRQLDVSFLERLPDRVMAAEFRPKLLI